MAASRAQWPLNAALLALCAMLGLLAGIAPGAGASAPRSRSSSRRSWRPTSRSACACSSSSRSPSALPGGRRLGPHAGEGARRAARRVLARPTWRSRRAGERQLFTAHPVMTIRPARCCWRGCSSASAGPRIRPSRASDVLRYALNFALLPIVYSAVQRREHVVPRCSASTSAGAVFWPRCTRSRSATPDEPLERISGLAGTANELASLLVTALFLAGRPAAGAAPRRRCCACCCLAAVAICLIGLFLTLVACRAGRARSGAVSPRCRGRPPADRVQR